MNIFEVVSLTQHTDRIDSAISVGIFNALRVLASEQGEHETAERHAALKNDLEPLIDELQLMFIKELKSALQRSLTSVIRKFSKTTGKSAFNGLYFKPMTSRGYADRNYVYLNEMYIVDIAQSIIDHIHELVLDNAYDDFSEAFFKYASDSSKLPRLQDSLLDAVKEHTQDLSSIVVHELVHTKQHAQQANVGRNDYEYRSYLEKYKGHFADLRSKDEENDEYYHLYFASPQEIAGFAHTIAVSLIHSLGLNKATRLQDVKTVTAQQIVSYVDNYLDSRYKNPTNPKELQVYKRYLKLVYIEVTNYLNSLKQKLSQS